MIVHAGGLGLWRVLFYLLCLLFRQNVLGETHGQ
jgi:hypothetical protein